MRPYYDQDGITIFNGDCLDVLESTRLEYDHVLGDPPYCSGGRQNAQARTVIAKSTRANWFNTDNMGTDTYVRWMRAIGGELFGRARQGAHLYLFTDWRQWSNLVYAVESRGWALRNMIVWDKAKGGAMGSFWRNNHELIAVFSKGQPDPIAHSSAFNTWTGAKPHADEHATVKPEGLITYILRATEGTVLDPWMGSGTTLVAAKQLGRKAIGIECDEGSCEQAAKRLAQASLFVRPPDPEPVPMFATIPAAPPELEESTP